MENLSSKQNLLMTNLYKFYEKTDNIDVILPILKGEETISLRIIDWFVTNYSKKHNIIYTVEKTKNGKVINDNFSVHLNYKNQLRAYSKKQFDPFCRRERIHFYYNTENYLVTTVGQLNFFKWIIENKIITYMQENIDKIETDMTENINKHYKSKKIDKRRKRKELSVSATKTLNKHKLNIVLDFD
mgnify:FL=1